MALMRLKTSRTIVMSEEAVLPRYVILDSPEDVDTSRVMIEEGPFESFVYSYGVVSIGEVGDNDGATLKFDYTLLQAPTDYDVSDEQRAQIDFETLIGDILVDIIANKEGTTEENLNDRESDIR